MKTMIKEKNHIEFKKEKRGGFSIERDGNFAQLMAMSFAFHSKYMETISMEKGQILQESPKFLKLMERISSPGEKVKLSLSDLKILNEWVKCITEIIIESPKIDLKDENMLKFFKISQDFVSKTGAVI